MVKKLLHIWLSFSRSERNGILILLLLLLILLLFWFFIPFLPHPPDPGEWIEETWIAEDSVINSDTAVYNPVSFYFDPNTISAEGWKQLGLTDKQIRTILNFRNAGGKFRSALDLKKIYGLDSALLERIIPLVQMEQTKTGVHQTERYISERPAGDETKTPADRYLKGTKKIEINLADSAALVRIYGIGPVMAKRIITYREKLGGFYSIDQLKEVWGMRPEGFEALRSACRCDTLQLRKIAVNVSSEKELSKHPYLSSWDARAITTYRRLKKTIHNIRELVDNQVISDSVFRKIAPYLSAE